MSIFALIRNLNIYVFSMILKVNIFKDAHNSIISFDEGKSLFAVYDGHGGHEVAEYCSLYLPNYIKQELSLNFWEIFLF